MFRSSSYNSVLHRDHRRQSNKTNDQYNRLEELADEFGLIRKEIYDDSEQNRLLQQMDEVQIKNMNSRQLQEINDRLKSLNISRHQQPVKGSNIKPHESGRNTQGINKNLLIPRVNRLAGLSSELRSLSEKVLTKDNTDISISNMSGATELTVPSCASWDIPYGSFHCVMTQAGDDSPSLSKSTETSEDDSEDSESQSFQVGLVQKSFHATNESQSSSDSDQDQAALEGSSSIKVDQLMAEHSLMWRSNSTNAPTIKEVAACAENGTNSNELAQPPNPEPPQSTSSLSLSSVKEGICLSECQSASGNPVTVLATPIIVPSVEGPTRMLQVLQLQCFPMEENGASPAKVPTSTLDNEMQQLSRDKDSMVMNQQSMSVNLSKPPRHPLSKSDHRETIMAGFSGRTTKVPKKSKKSKVTVAEIEALLNRENQENLGSSKNNGHARFHSIPSLQKESTTTPMQSQHRRVHSSDTARTSNVTTSTMMDGPNEGTSPKVSKFENSHEIFRHSPTHGTQNLNQQAPNNGGASSTFELEEISERRSERSTRRSVDRRKRSHSSNSSRSSRSMTISDERKEASSVPREKTTDGKLEKKRSSRSTSRNSSDLRSQGPSPSTSTASLTSSSFVSKDDSTEERANKSTCTDICGLSTNDLEPNNDEVDKVLREIRKRQLDRMISERVGVKPLGISMAEERLLQRIRDRTKQYDNDDDGSSSSPGEVDKALDVNSYRSRRHGRTVVNTLKLQRDVTPTRRMEQKDMDHVERRRFLEDFRNDVTSLEKREKRRRSVSRSIERRRRESKSQQGEEPCSVTTARSLSPLSRRSSNQV